MSCFEAGEKQVAGTDAHSGNAHRYCATVWVFANISGMITLLPDGTIHSVNHNFALMLFGYSQEELMGKVTIEKVKSKEKTTHA